MADFMTPELASTPSSPSTITLLQTSSGVEPAATIVTGIAPIPTSSLSGSQEKPIFSRPISVEYCEQVQVVWSGGDGPYSLVAYAPVSPTQMIARTNQTSWSFYNDFVSPGNILAISVLDNRGINTTSIYVVDGTNETCSTDPSSTASLVTTGLNNNSELPGTTIVGIIFAVLAFLIVVSAAFWVYRRKYSPQRVLRYVPNQRDGKPGDRSSIISGKSARSARSTRSALSLWSTFSNNQNSNLQRSNAIEDGVRIHIDTVQVVEDPYSPMTVPPTGIAHFTPRRTTREWTGYGMAENVRRDRVGGDSDAFNPSTIISTSSIPEETTEVEFPTHQIAKPGPSPFDDAHNVHNRILNGNIESSPIAPNTDPLEHDASQLSQRDLEALADIVAARLNQRAEHSPSPPQARVALNTTEEPPRYY